jgi:dimethylaniline monooxygenase (N-oxide forming)
VQLNKAIDRVVQNSDGTWSFVTNTGQSHTFDYCVVATGMYSSIPYVPETPGRDAFAGTVLHSSQFRDATVAQGRRVVVVGGGKSATDCAIGAATRGAAQSVTLIQRRAHWPTPLYIAGLIPFQHVFLSRLGQALVEGKVGVYPGAKSWAGMFRPIMGPIFAVVEALFAFQLGLRGDLRPNCGVVEDFYGYAQVQDDRFRKVRDSGLVKVELGAIESLTDSGVKLTNGQDMGADMVIYATGFGKDYAQLFQPEVMNRLAAQNDGLPLFKRILPPSIPGLAFVGSECATIFNCTSSGLQAEWLARTLAGETKQDLSEDAMKKEAYAFRDFARSWMPETTSRQALVLLHQLHYYDQLLTDMGENPSRKSNIIAEYLGSYYGADYNNIVGRPSIV